MKLKHLNRLGRWFCVLSLCCLLIPTVQADSPTFGKTLRLASGEHNPPFSEQSLPNGGLLPDLIQAAYAAVGLHVNMQYLPWRRALTDTLRYQYTASFPHYLDPELDSQFYYSDPILPLRLRVYLPQNSTFEYKSLASLTTRRFCLPNSQVIPYFLQKQVDTAAMSMIAPRDLGTCAQMLLKNRVDFMPLDERVYSLMLNHLGNIQASGELLSDEEAFFMVFPRNHPLSMDYLNLFNQGLAIIQQNGRFQAILDKHLAVSPFQTQPHNQQGQ